VSRDGAAAASLEVTAEPAPADVAAVRAGLHTFNAPHLGPADHRPLAVLARGGGRLLGGLVGETGRGFLQIDLLWVAPEVQGAGLGSRLLRAAETEAHRRGCRGAWVSTYDFQARPFYERHGYTVFGTLDGFTGGRRSFFLAKRLPSKPG
jgi:GNAT superfamily N-acetyltransferase